MYDRLNTLWARLLLGWGIPLILFLGVAVIASVVITRLVDALNWENLSYAVVAKGMTQEEHLTQFRLATYRISLEDYQGYQDKCSKLHREFQTVNAELMRMVRDSILQTDRLLSLASLEAEWQKTFQEDLPLLERRPVQSRDEFKEQVNRFVQRQEQKLLEMHRLSQAFLEHEQDLLQERRRKTLDENRHTLWFIAIASGVGLLFTFALMYQTARGVTGPVHRLQQAASRFLEGRFQTVTPAGPTEIAQLITHFNHMALRLLDRTSTLKNNEERYRTYIGAISQLLWVANPDGEVSEESPTWSAYTGQSLTSLRGLGWLDALHPEDRADVSEKWRLAIESVTPFETEARLKRNDGIYRQFHFRAIPVVAEDSTVREWMGTCVDITEQKEASTLRQAMEAAEAANRAKSDFLAKMSHELRTPLNAIIGMSKMLTILRFGPLTPKQADYLMDITAAGEHLLELINGILDLTSMEAGRMDVRAEAFDLPETICAMIDNLHGSMDAKRIRFQCHPPEGGILHTDRARFRQILFNLLTNAIKFTPCEGTITLEASWKAQTRRDAATTGPQDAQAVHLVVSDTGIGIPPEEQPRIWDEFHQVRSSSLQSHEGPGLGLALTRRVVHLLGGEIWLESEVDRGSRFHVILPTRYLKMAGLNRSP